MRSGKKRMGMKRLNLETEEELLALESNWRRLNVKDRAKSIRKNKCKRRIKKIKKWLKNHIN
jgi:hypothetical protein